MTVRSWAQAQVEIPRWLIVMVVAYLVLRVPLTIVSWIEVFS